MRTLLIRYCLWCCCTFCLNIHAQNELLRCGTDEYTQLLIETNEEFAQNYFQQKEFTSNSKQTAIDVVIPIVFHVLHNQANGQLIDENISEEQIQSQIDRLNTDFAGLNENIVDVPEFFQSLIAHDTGIRFCLADTDPDGNPSNGINRHFTTKEVFTLSSNDAKFAATGGADAWPNCDYLNVWICPSIINANDQSVLGYTQLPGGPTPTDGIVMTHRYVGNNVGTSVKGTFPDVNNYYLGRTMVHEVGHFLGLRHIWGSMEGNCESSDLVSDTPDQENATAGCAMNGFSCGSNDMIMNFMDYTYDECMMLFTSGQLERMELTLTAQPSRNCLLSASNSSCASSCFANAGTYQSNVFPAVCYQERTDALSFTDRNTQADYDFVLLIADTENNQQIIHFTSDLSIDFSELPEGFYSIHGFSFKRNQGIEDILNNQSHTVLTLQESLSLQNKCFDLILDNSLVIQHAAPLELSVSLECEEDLFGFRTGKALVQSESIGGSGHFAFIGAKDGDLLEHETQSFVRIQDSAGCFVQEFIEVDCPSQESQALGFIFLENQASITARQPNYFVQFYSPTDLQITAQVYNLTGQKIIENIHPTKVGINNLNFSTTNWSPGIYILALDNFNQRIQMRFLVY